MEMVSCKLEHFDCLSHSPNLGSGSLEWLSPTLTWSIEFDMPHGEVGTMPVSNISAASILYYIYTYMYCITTLCFCVFWHMISMKPWPMAIPKHAQNHPHVMSSDDSIFEAHSFVQNRACQVVKNCHFH